MRAVLIIIFFFLSFCARAQFVSNYQVTSNVDKTFKVESTSIIIINYLGSEVLVRMGDVEYRDKVVKEQLFKTDGVHSTYRVSTRRGIFFFETTNNTTVRVEWRPFDVDLVTVYEKSKA